MTQRSRGQGALGVALLRLLLVPIVFSIERSDPRAWSPEAETILLAAGVYAVVALVATYRSPVGPPGGWRPWVTADLLFLGLLAWQSGGAFSELRAVLATMPFVAAFVARPRSTLSLAALVVAVYVIASEAPAGAPQRGYVASEALLLGWGGGLAVLLSLVITSGRDQVLELATERRRLLDDTHSATERERQRLAYRLHHNAIQSLHAARLQLSRAERGDETARAGARAAIDDAVQELRSAVADLRPADVERVGLSNALRQIALRLLENVEALPPQIDIAVAPEVEGVADELWFVIAREILTNAVLHSHGEHIALTLTREGERMRLEVDDDGDCIAPGRRKDARREGHIGLAACEERANSRGGTFDMVTNTGRGTTVVVTLPVDQGSSESSREALGRRAARVARPARQRWTPEPADRSARVATRGWRRRLGCPSGRPASRPVPRWAPGRRGTLRHRDDSPPAPQAPSLGGRGNVVLDRRVVRRRALAAILRVAVQRKADARLDQFASVLVGLAEDAPARQIGAFGGPSVAGGLVVDDANRIHHLRQSSASASGDLIRRCEPFWRTIR